MKTKTGLTIIQKGNRIHVYTNDEMQPKNAFKRLLSDVYIKYNTLFQKFVLIIVEPFKL